VNTRVKKAITGAAALLTATTAFVAMTAGSGTAQPSGLRAFGISSDGKTMATFTTATPNSLDWVRDIVGFTDGETSLIGIDFRVQNGLMYGVGNLGNIYTITTPPQTPDVVVKKVSKLTVQLYGTNFGVDFNPAADRLRVISDNAQNLRHDLNTHTTVEDGTLTTPPVPGPTRGVTAAAYTNNDLNPDTVTTLFTIGTNSDQVLIQSPANIGTLAPTGALGVDASANAGFDIFSTLTNGKTTAATAFATIIPSGSTRAALYSVNLLTGATSLVGQFPSLVPITDIAITLTGS
jgi:hypothetical protein